MANITFRTERTNAITSAADECRITCSCGYMDKTWTFRVASLARRHNENAHGGKATMAAPPAVEVRGQYKGTRVTLTFPG